MQEMRWDGINCIFSPWNRVFNCPQYIDEMLMPWDITYKWVEAVNLKPSHQTFDLYSQVNQKQILLLLVWVQACSRAYQDCRLTMIMMRKHELRFLFLVLYYQCIKYTNKVAALLVFFNCQNAWIKFIAPCAFSSECLCTPLLLSVWHLWVSMQPLTKRHITLGWSLFMFRSTRKPWKWMWR